MKKVIIFGIVLLAVLGFAGTVAAEKTCTAIQDGILVTSAGDLLTTGYDQWGYNYQAHLFNGGYCDAYRDAAWCQPYADVRLSMKWNDAWISNMDCDGDGLLDRHFGFSSYIGSGAWETNHMWGVYEYGGQICEWDTFTKIVAVPDDAVLTAGIWYTADGIEIGQSIWGEFAIIQDVLNDPCAGLEGLIYNAPAPTGFGFYTP